MSNQADYNNPNYQEIFDKRVKLLESLKDNEKNLASFKVHYRSNPWDFIRDWGMTYEPRNVELGLITNIPFVPWPRQTDYLKWLWERWQMRERGLVEKSRDCGVTWLSVGFACTMWLFHEGFSCGFGSREADLVDKKGDPDCIFEKIRFFLATIPRIFKPINFVDRLHSAKMRIANPDNGSTITGDAGDDIGRGGRKSIYFVDEAAFITHQKAVDKALSNTTNCQIDISTPNGSGNPFHTKAMRYEGTRQKFIFDWREDPRKTDEWYEKQKEDHDEETIAQEIDRDYEASSEDAFIPAKWVRAAVDAHIRLGFEGEGIRVTSFDPADVGDAKAIINRHGSVIKEARQLTKGDITHALSAAYEAAEDFRADVFTFDGDGMGAPVIKTYISNKTVNRFPLIPYHGSAGVVDPDEKPNKKKSYAKNSRQKTKELHHDHDLRTNAETYKNYRAQTWSWVRERFRITYEAINRANAGMIVNVDYDDLISISSECEHYQQLVTELSRPKRLWSNGKIKVEAKEDMKKRKVKSPNLADDVIMAFACRKPKLETKPAMRFAEYQPFDPGMGA